MKPNQKFQYQQKLKRKNISKLFTNTKDDNLWLKGNFMFVFMENKTSHMIVILTKY